MQACRTKNESLSLADPTKNEQNNGLALIEARDLVSRAKVHPILLDESNFRVNGLRVGQQTFLKAETPVLIYDMPTQADYVEILRCPENVIIHGGADTLDYVELGSKDLETETRIYQRNNFWEAAVAASGCVLIATSYTDTTYEDTTAPSGSFNYYLRACVDQDRLLDVDNFSGINCSRQVSRSSEYSHINKRQKAELEALAEASKIRVKVDSINRQIVSKTMQLNQQLFECQQKHQTRVIDEEKKSAISSILGGLILFGIPVVGAVGYKTRQYFKPDYDFSYRTVLRKKNDIIKPGLSPNKIKAQQSSLIRSISKHEEALQQRIKNTDPAADSINDLKNELLATKDLAKKVKGINPDVKDSPLNQLKGFKDEFLGREPTSQVSKTTRAAQILAGTTITASAALLISHAYTAGSQSLPSYPRDHQACYGDGKASESVSCHCAQALSSQDDLNTLASDLEQTMRLHQQYLNKAETAREPGI